ncbi:MAG: hypothetical protein KDB24_11055 [Microthrixaceae bacterium]|nr:hypothetical protein [Microthrixaceae bacterium]
MATSNGWGARRAHHMVRAIAVLVVAFGGVALGSTAGAQDDYTGVEGITLEQCPEFVPGLTLESGEVAPEEDFVVSGDQYAAGAPINIYVCSTPIKIGSGTADAAGAFTAPAAIPAGLEAGAHDVFAYGLDPEGEPRLIGLQFEVAETPSTPNEPSSPNNPGTTGGTTGGTSGTPSAGTGTTGGTTAAGTTGGGTSGGGAGTPLATTGFGAALPSLLATALVVGGGLLMITVARKRREA